MDASCALSGAVGLLKHFFGSSDGALSAMMKIDVIDLKKEPTHIEQLAKWHHDEWSFLNPNGTVESRRQKMLRYLEEGPVPRTFIAKLDKQLVGSAAIVDSDMDTHPEYTPWLASVFVPPERRCKGIGAMLVKHVMAHASEHGIRVMYLFTPDKEEFYKRLGWATLSKEQYRNCPVTVMKARLYG